MEGAVTLDLVTTVGSVAAAAVVITIYLHRQIHGVGETAARERKAIEERAAEQVRTVEKTAAQARHELAQKFEARILALISENMALKDQFAQYRERAAETFMSKDSGSRAIDRVGAAVGELKDDLASRMERLENILLKNGRGH